LDGAGVTDDSGCGGLAVVCLRVGGPLAAGCTYIISLNLVSLTFAVDFGGGPIGVFVADLRTSAKNQHFQA